MLGSAGPRPSAVGPTRSVRQSGQRRRRAHRTLHGRSRQSPGPCPRLGMQSGPVEPWPRIAAQARLEPRGDGVRSSQNCGQPADERGRDGCMRFPRISFQRMRCLMRAMHIVEKDSRSSATTSLSNPERSMSRVRVGKGVPCLALGLALTMALTARAQLSVGTETGAVISGYNDVRVPNVGGERLSPFLRTSARRPRPLSGFG